MTDTFTDLKRVRDKLRQMATDSGMTQEQIGVGMGFSKSSARQAVSRLLNTDLDYDPRLSTIISFANAINKRIEDIL